MSPGVAQQLGPVLTGVLGGELPVRLRAWDGSEEGPPDAPSVVLRSERALRRLLWHPNELGLAQAYVTGELEVDGDLAEGLRSVWRALRDGGVSAPGPGLRNRVTAVGTAIRLGVVGPRLPAPESQVRIRGRLHSKSRDRAAISHHYDLSNSFYQLLLDPSMAYSCGYWMRPSGNPAYGLADAQRDKLRLICRQLDLRPGMRLLDIGCGWGSLSLHAAREHSVRVSAITLSRRQRDFVHDLIRAEGLEDLIEVELRDYRDLDAGGYDAVAAVEIGEHVGDAEYPRFAAVLHRMLKPGGRSYIQQISRRGSAPGGGAFIESYIAPDMHMRPLGTTVDLLELAGLEIRGTESMREHYTRTIRAWHATLERRWAEVVELVGEQTARVWRLYLVGSALAFEEGRMGVDRIVAVRPSPYGPSSTA
ncbi:class I SAM-dependent methyltransferase [Streptomyces sp. NPDC002403]